MIKLISLELARTKNAKKSGVGNISIICRSKIKNCASRCSPSCRLRGNWRRKYTVWSKTRIKFQRSIVERENMIQGKINEIWDIKDSLDQTFRETQMSDTLSDEGKVESNCRRSRLSPVRGPQAEKGTSNQSRELSLTNSDSYSGQILSVNDDNNFVIIDIGKEKKASGSGINYPFTVRGII